MIEAVAQRRQRSALALGGFAAAVTGAAAAGGGASRPDAWYRQLRKASFNPPDWVFGPAWTLLYGLMATSAWRVWRAPPSRSRTLALALWGGQLALNAAWSWLFFRRHRPRAALADLVALDALIAAYASRAAKVDRAAAWLMAPYLAWVSFAGVLNEEVVRLNPLQAHR